MKRLLLVASVVAALAGTAAATGAARLPQQLQQLHRCPLERELRRWNGGGASAPPPSFQNNCCSFMALTMSPRTFSFPSMNAVVAFCSPLTILTNVSSEAEIVVSASCSPSSTVGVPSSTRTVHFPAPSMSKRYVAFRPAAFEESPLRVSRLSKNWRAFSVGTAAAADGHEDEDQRPCSRTARDQHRAAAEAVRERPGREGADPAGKQHQRQEMVAVSLRVAQRDLPERDERDQAKPRDATEGNHAQEEHERADSVRLV